jgi:phage recombination protein Bet
MSNTAVVQFQAPRLPYHAVVEERFGVDKAGWKVLCEAVFPAAASPDSVVMALAYCKARNLDIFKKPVQIVPIWDKKAGRMVDTVWPGIAELRTTAMRTGSFAGFDETLFGPMIDLELSGVKVSAPEWAQCTVYRMLGGQRVPFVGPKVYWIETYATAKKDTKAPNTMWAKRPRGQLEKCAEAAALRRAFPEELGNDIAAEEIAPYGALRDVTARETPNLAARLADHSGDHPTEGFTAVHSESEPASPLGDDDIPTFDQEQVEASEGQGAEAPTGDDDGFPGDR